MFQVIWFAKSHAQWLVLLAFVILAFWRGAAPERQVASAFVAMFAFDRIYHLVWTSGIFVHRADAGHIVIDVMVFVIFGAIALRANRFYPLWLAAFQLIIMVSHIVRAASPAILRGAYEILAFAPSYLQVLVFGAGVILHIRRVARHGPYPSFNTC